MTLLESKLKELVPYLRSVAYRRNVPVTHIEDTVQSTLLRLLEEEAQPTAVALWGRATNVLREEAAKGAASSLPLSGVGFQAHHYARKYLAQSDFDPQRAYYNQTESPRVSMSLLQLVAGGAGSIDSLGVSDWVPSRDETEDVSEVASVMLDELPELLRTVVELKFGFRSNPLTNKEIAIELGIEPADVRKLWQEAKTQLACSIEMSEG